ncbi:28 kda heat- and acid-stable phosphoprotein [Quercus suber]|uniref:28 kDa heat- and acid-stable phosphoprotein n=1 Tax=Quercus suber TaxID=58331 RepID=A0AAW0L189_QUESU
MGRGKYKNKPTGKRQFSTPEDILAGTSTRPRTFRQHEAEHQEEESREESDEGSEEESGEESEESLEKRKGTQGIIEIENPNLVKPKSVKARDVDLGKTTELSRRERFVNERLSLIREQRAEAARKREEEKAAKEQKKAEARK